MKTHRNWNIAVVEDDLYFNKILTKYVTSLGNTLKYDGNKFSVDSYQDPNDFLDSLDEMDYDIVILDYYFELEDKTELPTAAEVLDKINEIGAKPKVIILSAQQNILNAVELMKKGVYEYADKRMNTHNRIEALISKIINEETRKQYEPKHN